MPGYGLYDLIGKGDFGLHPNFVISRTRYADVLINLFKDVVRGDACVRMNVPQIQRESLGC